MNLPRLQRLFSAPWCIRKQGRRADGPIKPFFTYRIYNFGVPD
jgi:hypothetical protein